MAPTVDQHSEVLSTLLWSSFLLDSERNTGFSGGTSGQESACQDWAPRDRFNPWVGKIPWRRTWQPTLVFLPEKSHGQRSLVGYNPWGRKELDTTEHACIIHHSQRNTRIFSCWTNSTPSVSIATTQPEMEDARQDFTPITQVRTLRLKERDDVISSKVPWELGFPDGTSGEELPCQCRRYERGRFDPWVRKICRRAWQPTLVSLPGESHGHRSLGGYSPRGHEESDTTGVT